MTGVVFVASEFCLKVLNNLLFMPVDTGESKSVCYALQEESSKRTRKKQEADTSRMHLERDTLLPSTGSGQCSSALVMLEKFIVLILPSLAPFQQRRGIFKRPFTVPRCLLGLRERDSERGKFAFVREVTTRAELVEACT